jgi:hypothetical protein
VCFQNVSSPETGRKQMATHYRFAPLEQVVQGSQTHVRDTQAPQKPDVCRRLDGILRPRGRLLHTRHTGGGLRFHYGKLSLYILAGRPMGWKCSTYYFGRLYEVFIRHLREPMPNPTGHTPRLATNLQPTRPTPSRRYRRKSQWRGARLLPSMVNFFFLPTAET